MCVQCHRGESGSPVLVRRARVRGFKDRIALHVSAAWLFASRWRMGYGKTYRAFSCVSMS